MKGVVVVVVARERDRARKKSIQELMWRERRRLEASLFLSPSIIRHRAKKEKPICHYDLRRGAEKDQRELMRDRPSDNRLYTPFFFYNNFRISHRPLFSLSSPVSCIILARAQKILSSGAENFRLEFWTQLYSLHVYKWTKITLFSAFEVMYSCFGHVRPAWPSNRKTLMEMQKSQLTCVL